MKIITINSSRDIFVYGTSYTQNKSSDQRPLNLNTVTWLRTKIKIKSGIHNYPAEIKDWDTVKALANVKILTVSAPFEGELEDDESKAAVESKVKADQLEQQEKIEAKKKQMRKAKLEELADKAVEKQYEEAAKE